MHFVIKVLLLQILQLEQLSERIFLIYIHKKEQDSVNLRVGFCCSCLGTIIQHILAYTYYLKLHHLTKIGPQCGRVATSFLFALVCEHGAD